jgi:16S rRNA (uracil1498-N3)-methyltransferase
VGRSLTAPVFLASRDRLAEGDTVVLDGAEGRHAAVVRRLDVGEEVRVVDGTGLSVDGVVSQVRRDAVLIDVRARSEQPQPQPRLVVVQALAKGDRGERAVEAMTEVGVDEIVPWAASRSVTQWKAERATKGLDRWRSTAREAAKQSRRSWFPVVGDVADTATVTARLAGAAFAIVCHEGADDALASLTTSLPVTGEIAIVVGPEGGIADSELAAFTTAGSTAYRLGPTVLRTSTAGVVAATVVLSRTPRWS